MTDTITLPRSVAMQALEALKIGHESAHDCAETFHIEMAGYKQQRHEALDAEVKQISDAIGVLRAALEQPQGEQEPVAWAEEIIEYLHAHYDTEMIKELDSGDALIRLDDAIAAVEEVAQRHARPQPKRQPLTDEEIRKIGNSLSEEHRFHFRMFARAIERAHGIGGDA